jgi:Tol biopolymer transport system component
VGAVGNADVYGNVAIAPNGKTVAVDKTDVRDQNTIDIWTYELEHDRAKRFTFGPGLTMAPIWSPDGSQLVYTANRQLLTQILFMKNVDGTEEEKRIMQIDKGGTAPNDWSRDGKYVLYSTGSELGFITLPELKNSLFLKAPFVLRNGQFSPDGRWVAYASNETGKWEVFVTSFPDARGKWQVSTDGGEQPRWRSDGKELFYLSSESKIMAVPVTTGAKFDTGAPIALFQATPRQPVVSADIFVYDVSRDGQRLLINTPVKQGDTQPMSIVLNWSAKLTN